VGRLMIDVLENKLFECLFNWVEMLEGARLGKVLGLCERCVMIFWCDAGAK
jgi:hypothetical protein